jgi:hypothetical protein
MCDENAACPPELQTPINSGIATGITKKDRQWIIKPNKAEALMLAKRQLAEVVRNEE